MAETFEETFGIREDTTDVVKLIDEKLNANDSVFDSSEKEKLKATLLKYNKIISVNSSYLGRCSALEHEIDIGDAPPIVWHLVAYHTTNKKRSSRI